MKDYTKARLGSKDGISKIVKCPKCGKKGLCRNYDDGNSLIIHTAEDGGFCSLVREHCYITKGNKQC